MQASKWLTGINGDIQLTGNSVSLTVWWHTMGTKTPEVSLSLRCRRTMGSLRSDGPMTLCRDNHAQNKRLSICMEGWQAMRDLLRALNPRSMDSLGSEISAWNIGRVENGIFQNVWEQKGWIILTPKVRNLYQLSYTMMAKKFDYLLPSSKVSQFLASKVCLTFALVWTSYFDTYVPHQYIKSTIPLVS